MPPVDLDLCYGAYRIFIGTVDKQCHFKGIKGLDRVLPGQFHHTDPIEQFRHLPETPLHSNKQAFRRIIVLKFGVQARGLKPHLERFGVFSKVS